MAGVKKIIKKGKKFGRLTIIKEGIPYVSPNGDKVRRVECLCECGNKTLSRLVALIDGSTKSCGCYRETLCSRASFKHGMSSTKFYNIFSGIKARCNNINEPAYKNYGGRGIKCEWNDFNEFKVDMYESFLKHTEEYGKKHTTIDRTNNDGNYCKENCRWATRYEQGRNKRNNRFLTFRNQTKTITEWAREVGINKRTLYHRIDTYGWTIERSLTQEVQKQNRN